MTNIQKAIQLAKKRFNPECLTAGQYICTDLLGNNTLVYKVFGWDHTRHAATIALPDMVMREVPFSSLYDPDDAGLAYFELIANPVVVIAMDNSN